MNCELCEHPAAARVHPGCRGRLDERLAALPGAWRALALWLAPSAAGDRLGGRTRAEAPLPVRLDVLDLRARGGIERLTDWERDWRDWLGWSPPPFRGDVGQTVDGAVAFLRGNLLWACDEHPAVRDFAQEVGVLGAEIASIVAPASRSRRLGYCPADHDGSPCGAVVRLAPGQAVAVCAWCRAEYPPATWLQLRADQQLLEAS